MKTLNKNTLIGLIKLFRAIPVFTYSGSLIFMNIAFAQKYREILWHHLLPLAVGVLIINGLLTHSLNDINDWESGTDQASKGILSGGSKVIKQGLLDKTSLNMIAYLSLFITFVIGIYLYMFRGILVLAAVAVGVFAAWAYTCPPFRLAYSPFLGELIGIWIPGVVLSTASYFVLTGEFHLVPFFAALIQTTLILGWIMLHHIPDIHADLLATPRKLTTPALCFQFFGPKGAILPSIFYSCIAAMLSFLSFLYVNQVFAWMVIPCFIVIWAGVTANVIDIRDVTKRQLVCIAAIVANSIVFALLV